MGPRVKFAVDAKDIQDIKTRLLTNDVKEDNKLGFMVFRLGDEAWVKVEDGPCRPDLGAHLSQICTAENAGKHLIFRSKDNATDVWIKYIPDSAPVKERTCFATASDSLLDSAGVSVKNKLECRDATELKEALSKYL